MGAALQQRARLAAEDQRLPGSKARAPVDPLIDKVGCAFLAGTRTRGQAHGVTHDRVGHRHLAHDALDAHHLLGAEHRVQLHVVAPGGLANDAHLVLLRQVVDEHVEHESVELRLRQRVGALHLNRVLRGEHEKRLGQLTACAADGHLFFLHRLEQRGLRLGRRAVDLVGQQDVGEHRAFDEA